MLWIGFIDSFSKFLTGRNFIKIKLIIVKDMQKIELILNASIVNLSTIIFPKSLDTLIGRLKNKSSGTKEENMQLIAFPKNKGP